MWRSPIFFLAGKTIAVYVEGSFGEHEDHLNLQSICGAIDATVGEILG